MDRATWLLVIVASVLIAPQAHAFKPDIHRDITRRALEEIEAALPDRGPIRFTDSAIREIEAANARTDESCVLGVCSYVFGILETPPEWHVDNETLPEASARIRRLRDSVVVAAQGGSPLAAREHLGALLHTVQDFYSHSTWIENGNPGIVDFLTDVVLRSGEPTCYAGAPPMTRVIVGSDLSTGYFSVSGSAEAAARGRLKCQHGRIPGLADGIHKDDSRRVRYGPARARAIEASRVFVEKLLASMEVEAKCALLGQPLATCIFDGGGDDGEEGEPPPECPGINFRDANWVGQPVTLHRFGVGFGGSGHPYEMYRSLFFTVTKGTISERCTGSPTCPPDNEGDVTGATLVFAHEPAWEACRVRGADGSHVWLPTSRSFARSYELRGDDTDPRDGEIDSKFTLSCDQTAVFTKIERWEYVGRDEASSSYYPRTLSLKGGVGTLNLVEQYREGSEEREVSWKVEFERSLSEAFNEQVLFSNGAAEMSVGLGGRMPKDCLRPGLRAETDYPDPP